MSRSSLSLSTYENRSTASPPGSNLQALPLESRPGHAETVSPVGGDLRRLVERAIAAARPGDVELDGVLGGASGPGSQMEIAFESLLSFVMSVVVGVTGGGAAIPVAPEVEQHAAHWAAEGLSIQALVRLYGIAHRLSMHSAIWTIESDPRSPELTRDLLARAAETGSRMHVAATEALMAGFSRVQARDRRAAGNWKLRLVRRVLTGEPVDGSPLGYALDGFHVALVAQGADAESAASAVQGAWRGRALRICADAETLFLWLALDSLERSSLPRPALELSPGTALALGDPGAGRAGFIDSHRQALVALRLGSRVGRAVGYEQVALVALLAQDEVRGRQFVARELGHLQAEGAAGELARSTVRAYLDSQCNLRSTAARMGVHENTIGKRLRLIEARLGRTLRSRSTELDVALRLHDLDRGGWAAASQMGR